MKVPCPKCGKTVVIQGLGRKRLAIPLIIVYESLQSHKNNVAEVAKSLNCSEGYIFGVLKANGLHLKDIKKGDPYK